MRQFHNELIDSPDNVGLLRARHANTNDVIISDTMIRYFAPPQLPPMIDLKKSPIVYGKSYAASL